MSKYCFTLKKIDPIKINKKYSISTLSNLDKTNIPSNSTKIMDLPISIHETKQYSYLDETKKSHNCIFTMRDMLFKSKLPLETNIHCFWCKHSFNNPPIGCPIQYVSSKLTKNYYSEITKDTYTIRGNITPYNEKNIKSADTDITLNNKHYYVTDGIFCSFNCCLAFIKDNWYNKLYSNSEILLNQIYNKLFDNKNKIIKAPSWRILKIFGGDINIEEFRTQFNKIQYIEMGDYLNEYPQCKPIGFIFEKKLKF